MDHQEKVSIAVVIPTYNNRGTIQKVLYDVLNFTSHIFVVNDGSTDGTDEVLESFPEITVIHHKENQGKGAALLSGFQKAHQMGYTHVITLDADGQHFGKYIPMFQEALLNHPKSLVIGVRQLKGKGRPLKSRILRGNSNFWTLLATGRWTKDSQSGYRGYPLSPLLDFNYHTGKYDFEIEVLVKALWFSLDLVFIPMEVGYGPGSISHFRPIQDFLLVARLFIQLILLACFVPLPVRQALILSKRGEKKKESFY